MRVVLDTNVLVSALECAEAGEGEFLVTGNLKHFPSKWSKTRVVRARTLLELIRPRP